MIEQAKKFPFERLYCQNLEEPLQESSESFDAVVCVGVFDFIVQRKHVMNEIARILKQGGVAGLTIPADSMLEEDVVDLLTHSNLRMIKSERLFGYKDSQNGLNVDYLGLLLQKI